ncbi:hypothetical protein HYPSUDRAFT_65627 [Hypholoma sublateritium FD-334 SS-4]|uniref:Uncharacterized protein n=1 Tax=Hypholoma sublateritium (strain FD-334 SS-4) TaxID=945553 RepID=A0A0D2MKV9_HYPSF|nr:hypothetical protein HYPSUDRAFT_65627 [Hypholoma sublateritium FD-334 SS-4]
MGCPASSNGIKQARDVATLGGLAFTLWPLGSPGSPHKAVRWKDAAVNGVSNVVVQHWRHLYKLLLIHLGEVRRTFSYWVLRQHLRGMLLYL